MRFDGGKVTAGAYMRHLGAMILAENWLWMVLPLAVCAVLAIWVDVRFIIVALMVLFIVLPMVLALLYFYYGFSPEARWSIMDKQVDLTAEGLELTFTDERMKKHAIPRDSVRSIIEKNDVWMLMMSGGRRYTCLMLPSSTVNPDVAEALREFVTQTH
ncbi:MAG: hypothetical protein IJS04_07920 [Muribaculaceae bacterium]|nr:hypothetical protein [Muribaculaceae bacterium]MBQ7205750.1 hypothetical protein [Muribaculaceae bacterium]